MNRVYAACIVAGLVLAANSPASSQDATSAWGNSWDFKNSNERVVSLNRANIMHQAENGGLTAVTNIAGDVIHNSTYQGPVNQANSTNVGNLSSTTSNINAQDSNVTLTVSTGQSTDNVNQGANSDATTRGPRN